MAEYFSFWALPTNKNITVSCMYQFLHVLILASYTDAKWSRSVLQLYNYRFLRVSGRVTMYDCSYLEQGMAWQHNHTSHTPAHLSAFRMDRREVDTGYEDNLKINHIVLNYFLILIAQKCNQHERDANVFRQVFDYFWYFLFSQTGNSEPGVRI